MKICAVIAEYNPFHTGHALQFEYIRKNIPDAAIVAIMSGNVVQRGELAVLDKYTRAEAALACGADAVLELPYPWCGGSAGYFAKGGVEIARGIGADYLCFGSESGDIEELKAVAERTASQEYNEYLDTLVEKEPDTAYIPLSRKAYRELYGCDMPGGANNTLAIEYLKNIGDIIPVTYKRTYPSSATAARGYYRGGDMAALKKTIPDAAFEIYKSNTPVHIEMLGPIVMWHLRNADSKELCRYADVDEGLASRMINAANECDTLTEFFEACATKKYTNSRLRRAVLNILLGTTKKSLEASPQFTTLLAANQIGCKAIRQIKKQGSIEIITKPADHAEVEEQFLFSNRADKLFVTVTGKNPACVLKRKPIIL